ncbi:MAG: Heterodimeric efflux ABC transporter, permease/ATP-binding subunit 2, partial [uncultured Chloroflexia bacterium]
MKVWQYTIEIIRFRFRFWAINLAGIIALIMLDLVPGQLLRRFFDWLTGASPAALNLWTLVGLYAAVSLGRTLAINTLMRTNTPFSWDNFALLRKNLLRHILNAPGARALPSSTGEAISRFGDDIETNVGTIMWMNDMIAFSISTTVAVIIMLRINSFLTLAVLLPMVFVLTIANIAGTRIEQNRIKSREAAGKVSGFLGEVIGGVQAVQVNGAEGAVTNYFRTINEERRIVSVRDRLFEEILMSVFRHTSNLGVGVILILAAQSIRDGSFTVGDFVLFAAYLEPITAFTGLLGAFFARYKQMGVSYDRMATLLHGAPPSALVAHGPIYRKEDLPEILVKRKQPEDQLEVLEVENLSYRYPDSGRGISDVNLRLPRGSFTVVTGRIGSGKTTLLRAVLGLLPAESGHIRWNEQLVEDAGAFMTPPRSAYTPQVPRLCSESIKDNILLGLPEKDVDMQAALTAAVLEPDLETMPDGLDTLIGPRGVRLSGGQAQRVAAARMFIRDAELIVCDDLSSALDVETERTLWERVFAKQH